MFSLFKKTVSNLYSSFTSTLNSLFSQSNVDEQTLTELEQLLIKADVGMKPTTKLVASLRDQMKSGAIENGSQLKEALEKELHKIFNYAQPQESDLYLLVGINGSGKTTFAAKLAHRLVSQKKKTLLIAADTFRAAAPEQLQSWATATGADIFIGSANQDPASVVFQGLEKFRQENYDAVIIDTAGRLQTKANLMQELEKIKRVVSKKLPNNKITTLLTVDAMLGQNSFEQARLFHEATQLSGIVLTKMDGTAKGGIAIAITQTFNLPIYYVSFGEAVENCAEFNPAEYIQGILG